MPSRHTSRRARQARRHFPVRGSRCQSPKSGVPLSVSRRRNRPASSRRIGRKHPPAATPEARAFHPQATSPNRPSAPASTTPRPAIRRRLSLPAFDHRPQETSCPRDHTPFLFPVGLGLGVVPAHAYVISAAPTFKPAPERSSGVPLPQKSPFTALLPASAARPMRDTRRARRVRARVPQAV